MEDAALVQASDSLIDVNVALAEPLGAELIVHFPLEVAPALEHAPVAGASDTERPFNGARFTARLSPRSHAQTGRPLRLAVDAERLHFFDAETGVAI
jgi:multiple sugar transport system ATP-binding protein